MLLIEPLAKEQGWPRKLEKARSMFKVATCSLETWLSVKILITGFQALDPAIPALDGMKPPSSHVL